MTRCLQNRLLVGLTGSALLLTGCATTVPTRSISEPAAVLGSSAAQRPLPLDLLAQEKVLRRGEKMRWGLALSGGGLRAAMFSLGVLKGLYDSSLLNSVDVISTVSGGGYTGYWLYANQLAAGRSTRFGSSSLANAVFPNRLCELVTKANFVPYGKAARGLVGRGIPASVKLYEDSLLRTFGGADRATEPIRLTDLTSGIARGEMPYFVQNATFYPAGEALSWPQKLLEFTPLVYGSSEVGYRGWGGAGARPLPLLRTTAISGAARPELRQQVPLVHPGTGAPTITAFDGGRSENLGAMALIRRGVPNIIIADAEHDPGYTFEAYRTLKAGAALSGLEFRAPAIDEHLQHYAGKPYLQAVTPGEVRAIGSHRLVSTFYYIKATMPTDLSGTFEAARAPGSIGRLTYDRFALAMRRTSDPASGNWRCDQLSMPAFNTLAWAAYSTASYSDYVHRSVKARFVRIVSDLARKPAMRIDFPQYSTADQSFYLDQAQAFVGLGYLEAQQMAPYLPM